MKNLGKIFAHIPARAGSKRVKAKNLRMISGSPLLSYSINAALNAKLFDEVFVNSDSDEMLELAKSLGASVYKRKPELADDNATGDEFTYDFIKTTQPDTLVMISPVCPLITEKEIIEAVESYAASDCDTLITCESTQMQAFCNGKGININVDEQLAPSQSNPHVQILNWAVTVWNVKSFVEHYEQHGSAYIGKQRLLHPIEPLKSVKISKESDFKLAEALLHGQKLNVEQKVQYWTKK